MESELITRMERLEKLILQVLDAQKPSEPAIGIGAAAEALFGDRTPPNVRKLRYLAGQGFFVEGEHWANLAPADRNTRYGFYIQACRDRLNTKTHSR